MTIDIIDSALSTLTFLTALGCGLFAGVFLAFSTFVIKALGRLPPHEGIAAMQSINVVVLNPLFLAVFVGTAIACVLLVIAALASAGDGGATWLLLGSAVYLIGTFVVTGLRNVPMNNTLAAGAPSDRDGAKYWALPR
jgi:uncharacterized membrane protein